MSEGGDARSIDALLRVMAALRAPGSGCRWDLEQSFASIAPYTVEEAYEVADAIEREDLPALKDELGDLLLQVVYHARMAEEIGAFAFADVVEGIVAKMVRRHPHVFGGASVASADELRDLWERVKAEERAAAGPSVAGAGAGAGALSGVPLALPALTRAGKLQAKAARAGFDWPDVAPVLVKAREELGELEAGVAGGASREDLGEELGDLLFAAVNVARHLGIDPEAALRRANAKFERRFAHVEAGLRARGRTPADSDLADMDRLWDEAKARERDAKR